jgi:hypothetical protein
MSAPPAPVSKSPAAPGTPEGPPGGAPAPSANGSAGLPAALLPIEAPEVVSPADLVRPPRRWERLVWYAGATVLALLLAVCGMQIWDRDLRAPFYYDLDALLYLPLTRSVIEQGFWNCWHIDRLGAPGTQELFDFPIIDFLHFAFLWAIGRFVSDTLLVYNIYSLLTYPLTALTAMWVLRWLKVSLPTAALGGLLYTFLPYHQERYHYHYFLAAYWWVPVSLVPALAICKGDLPFFAPRPDGSRRWNLWSFGALWTVSIGVVTAAAGAYYAFFACATYGFAGLYGWVVHRTWRAAASAVLVIVPVVAVGYSFHLSASDYQRKYRVNPVTQRYPEESDSYGLKLAHLLLPATDHNLRPLANLRTLWAVPNRPSEGERAGSLGVIGGTGLVALLALAMFPMRTRRWPTGALSAVVLYMILLATIGAFGSIFNLLITPQIRAYNRICVFIAFMCLAAVVWWLDRFLLTRTGRWSRRARYPVLGALLVVGYLDQTPWGWNPINPKGMQAIDVFAERFRSDKAFFKKIEDSMPPGSKVFCLPYVAFPETPPVFKMGNYEHARGYLMTDTLCWSYGAIKGREADAWQKDVTDLMARDPERMMERIVARGFDGMFIDGRGFPGGGTADRAAALIKRLNDRYQAYVGNGQAYLPKITHDDGRQFFLDLRPFREAWREKKPAEYAQCENEEREWIATLWLDGFSVANPPQDGSSRDRIFFGPFDATIVFDNPTDRARVVDVSFVIAVDLAGPFDITFSGLVEDRFSLEKIEKEEPQAPKRHTATKKFEKLELPPGRSTIHIRCRPPSYFLPLDKHNLCYYITDFALVERK